MICDIWAPILPPASLLADFLRACSEAAETKLLEIVILPFPTGGATGVAILAQSHIAIHTWPQQGYAALDMFTCGSGTKSAAILDLIAIHFSPTDLQIRNVERGVRRDSSPHTSNAVFVERAPDAAEERHYSIDGPIRTLTSGRQRIDSFTSPTLGRVLALDGVLQVAELDSYVYHELITHPALCAHHHPSTVVIVGGGDGHALIEVLKHREVTKVYVLEVDAEVIAASSDLFPAVRMAFEDPRLVVQVGDGMVSLAGLPETPDIIIGDLTDPVGQAKRFVTREFFALAARVLGPDGILVNQSSSMHYHPRIVQDCLLAGQKEFKCVRLLSGAMATYPGAWWTFAVCAKIGDPRQVARTPSLETRLYNPAIHSWFFVPDQVTNTLLPIKT